MEDDEDLDVLNVNVGESSSSTPVFTDEDLLKSIKRLSTLKVDITPEKQINEKKNDRISMSKSPDIFLTPPKEASAVTKKKSSYLFLFNLSKP